jgi:hypothetical protein
MRSGFYLRHLVCRQGRRQKLSDQARICSDVIPVRLTDPLPMNRYCVPESFQISQVIFLTE